MAIVHFWNALTGDFSECPTALSASLVSSGLRSGSISPWAARINPSAVAGSVKIKVADAGGQTAPNGPSLGLFSAYFGLYAKWGSAPAAQSQLFAIISQFGRGMAKAEIQTSGTACQFFYRDSSNTFVSMGTTTGLSTGTWYLFECKILNSGTTSGATVEFRINGTVQFTVTGVTLTADAEKHISDMTLAGSTSTYDFYYMDVEWDDAAYPGGNQGCAILRPNSAGGSTGWTTGNGTTFASVDEATPDADTTYIGTSTSGVKSLFAIDALHTNFSSAGKIAAVRPCVIFRDETAISSLIMSFVSGATTSSTSPWANVGTTYLPSSKLLLTDPNTSAAWTGAALDASQIGPQNNSANAVRCTWAGVMVLIKTTVTGVSASYGGFTRTGPNNSPWTLGFTGAGGLTTYQVRTANTPTGGSQVATGAAADGANSPTIAYNATGLVNGSQTLYLFVSNDSGTTWSAPFAFTLLRDDISPNASTSISTNPSLLGSPSATYTVTATPSDSVSTSGGEMAYQIRTATGGGGTLLASGSGQTNGSPFTTGAFSDAGLVVGANTRYVRTRDGANNWTDTAFTVTVAAGKGGPRIISQAIQRSAVR